MNHDMLDELERLGDCKVCQYVGRWVDIRNAIDRLYREHKPQEEDELTDLGSMLLGDEAAEQADEAQASDKPDIELVPPPSSDGSSEDIAATVDALTGGNTTDVLQEALAAVEQGGPSGASAPGGSAPPPPPPPQVSTPSGSTSGEEADAPSSASKKMSAFSSSAKMSAFATGSKGGGKAPDAEEAAEGSEDPKDKQKLLGILKKK
jgi:hypothetical protein